MSARLGAVDMARGVAVLLMIQTHAYDGWVTDAARTSLVYRGTRTLGTYPLPTFLLLAGLGLTLRASSIDARRAAVRAGLRVFGTGYALAFAYGLLDGGLGAARLLHVDILHAIGLSVVVLAWSGMARPYGLGRAGLVACLLAVALCPPLTHFGHSLTGPTRYLVAPLVEVPGISPMPLIPLIAFAGLGAWLGPMLLKSARPFVMLLGSLATIGLAQLVIARVIDAAHPLARTEPTIVLNVIDLSARASAVLLACVLWERQAASRLARRCGDALCLLGRRSLWVYAFHLPFCYGRFARPLKHSLDMPTASAYLLALCAASWLVAVLADARTRAGLRRRLHSTRASS